MSATWHGCSLHKDPIRSCADFSPAPADGAVINHHLSSHLCQNCVVLSENILKYAIISPHLINLTSGMSSLYVKFGSLKVWIRRFFSLIKVDGWTENVLLLIIHGYPLDLFNYTLPCKVPVRCYVSTLIDGITFFYVLFWDLSYYELQVCWFNRLVFWRNFIMSLTVMSLQTTYNEHIYNNV